MRGMMERKSTLGKGSNMNCHINHGNYIPVNCYIVYFIICCLLSSCQKSANITVYLTSTSDSNSIGELLVQDDDYENALRRCQERLEQMPKESSQAAEAYKIMGGIYATYLNDRETAVYYINKAIEIDMNESNEIGLAQDYNQMAKTYIYIGGNQEEGLSYVEMAEQIYQEHGMSNTLPMAGTLSNKGQIYKNQRDYENAIMYFEKAQEIYKQNQLDDIVLYIYTGQAYLDMGKYGEAEERYLKAKEICIKEQEYYYLAEVWSQLGWLYKEQGKYLEAIDFYEHALVY